MKSLSFLCANENVISSIRRVYFDIPCGFFFGGVIMSPRLCERISYMESLQFLESDEVFIPTNFEWYILIFRIDKIV